MPNPILESLRQLIMGSPAENQLPDTVKAILGQDAYQQPDQSDTLWPATSAGQGAEYRLRDESAPHFGDTGHTPAWTPHDIAQTYGQPINHDISLNPSPMNGLVQALKNKGIPMKESK